MSVKRQASTDLNHENWDQEDPSVQEEMGTFKQASKDVLEKRVIKTARRRVQAGDESKKSGVFSGFGGFNKAPASSFDFLSKLINGSNNNGNETPASQSDSTVSSSLFGNKTTSTNSPMFRMSVSSSSPVKSAFTMPTTQVSSGFGMLTNTTASSSVFVASKVDSTVTDSPFKIKTSPLTADATPETNVTFPKSSSLFCGIGSNNPVSIANTNSSPPSKPLMNSPVKLNNKSNEPVDNKSEDSKKLTYYTKLKGLNESVSDWIKKHVEETPLCILSPIFKDYESYLKEIQEEYHGSTEELIKPSENIPLLLNQAKPSQQSVKSLSDFSSTNSGSSLMTTSPPKVSVFGQSSSTTSTDKPGGGFSFGTNTALSSSPTAPIGGFSFGSTPKSTTTTSSLFTLEANKSVTTNGSAPFSFGSGKPFSFSPNTQVPPTAPEQKAEEVNEDEPPKVEYNPVVEENSVFEKKCKLFVKKDGNFVDKGVGTLYVKKIAESDKHQLLVRANTTLGNVLVNLILTSGIPTQRLGKNNVMMVCIPTPEAKPPPTPILIRVKTPEEADQLLETLDKYKG